MSSPTTKAVKTIRAKGPPPLDVVATLGHPKLFQPWFAGPTWNGWKTVLKATSALDMTVDEVEFFKSIAGGRNPPKRRVRELWPP